MKPLLTEQVTIEDFAKLDIRVVQIFDAEEVPGADKLVKLNLYLGDDAEGAQIFKQCFAGIKKYYPLEALKGRSVVYLANLKPRQMKFGLSEGMVLAVSNEDHSSVQLLLPLGEPGDTIG